jgi:signal transduction histidine kinase
MLQAGLLVAIILALAATSLVGLYSYRELVKSISGRAAELPIATTLGRNVTDMRVTLTEIRQVRKLYDASPDNPPVDCQILYEQFGIHLQSFEQTLARYRKQLQGNEWKSPTIGDSRRERETVGKIEDVLTRIATANRDGAWILDEMQVGRIDGELQKLQGLAADLPSYLHGRMRNFADEVRGKYRTLIYATWATIFLVGVTLLVFGHLFYAWIFRPLRVLIAGSRRVAGGDFDHRIHLGTEDEMAHLSEAMNSMTDRFQAIRDDLDRQVRERTMQMVRSNQLASIGFLAAGVAHEINNPMASIAMCAESLERRVDEGVVADNEHADGARKYLRMIQDEAFRCKRITDQLLDFSRTGEHDRHNADLRELIQGVVEMVSHLGKSDDKHIVLSPCKSVVASVHPQEIKQVVLNLITNALDSIDAGGTVRIDLGIMADQAEIRVSDDGCGMTDEVRENLFEPFFTRRRSGQGTGLGLSIVNRIVCDHDGHIEAESEGPGKGSLFRVTLPLAGAKRRGDAGEPFDSQNVAA